MIERRGFLKTLVAGTTSAGLILRATQSEVEAFGATPRMPVTLMAEIPHPLHMDYPVLYSESGEPVAMLVDAQIRARPFDVTRFDDNKRIYMAGGREIDLRVDALPAANNWLVREAEKRARKGKTG